MIQVDRESICETTVGSHLYGPATEKSNLDRPRTCLEHGGAWNTPP
jgi:hypothetical protein